MERTGIDPFEENYLKGYEYETLMNALRVSVFKCLLNEEFTAIWCNNYFFESTGYTKEEYVSIYRYSIRDYFSCMMDEYKQISAAVLEAFSQGRSGFECISRMPQKGGTFIWIKVNGTFTNELRNGIPVLYVVYTDITDVIEQQELRKKLEERSELLREALDAAERANHAKSDFLSRMSHDIRTPLNAIIGMTEIAESHLNNQEKMHDCHKKIALSSRHLLGLINDVLDMSKIESGKMLLNNDTVFLPEVLDNVVTIIQPDIKARNQHFTVRRHHVTVDYVYTDALRLRQVFLNILSNACKFTPEGGTITFDVEELERLDDKTVKFCFRFSDNGIGIKPEFLDHIFDSFTREHDSRVDKTVGSGLGMAITKKIVDMLGGEILVSSESGAGTTFQVILPLRQDESIRPETGCVQQDLGTEQKFDFSGRRFLLAEDNDLNREIAVELLSATGAQIDWVSDGAQCVERFHASPEGYYDLILMDIQMPVMNGYTATKKIRNLPRRDAESIQIWAMTADAFMEDIMMAKSVGMNGHFAKPLNILSVNREISRILS